MMKKILLYGILLFLIVGCKKQDNIYLERSEGRLTAVLESYQKQLYGSEDGWFGYLFSKGGKTSSFLFQFDDQGRVSTLADINSVTAKTRSMGTYRLKATQLPCLYFDTYSYLPLLSDPDPVAIGGTRGIGLESDLEFSILESTKDVMYLKGNLHGSKMILVRANKEEKAIFEKDPLMLKEHWNGASSLPYYYNRLTLGAKSYDITINTEDNTISFFYNNGGFKQFSTAYAYTPTGIILKEPFIDGDKKVVELRNIQASKNQGKINLIVGTIAGTIQNVSTPLSIDVDAPKRMYSGSSYLSLTGFTVNGVTDAYKISTTPFFRALAYYPSFESYGFSSLQLYYNSSLWSMSNYGPLFSTKIEPDGRIIFHTSTEHVGDSPGVSSEAILTKTTAQFLNPDGFYVFQTGANSYDLVSVADSRVWIRF